MTKGLRRSIVLFVFAFAIFLPHKTFFFFFHIDGDPCMKHACSQFYGKSFNLKVGLQQPDYNTDKKNKKKGNMKATKRAFSCISIPDKAAPRYDEGTLLSIQQKDFAQFCMKL